MKKALLSVLLVGVGLLAGCGGSSTSGGGGGGGGTTPTLVSITVTPATPSISPGATQQFTATGNYSDSSTKNLTTSANWLSSNGAVATINIAGLATAVAAGTTTISATSGSVAGSTTLSVAAPPNFTLAASPAAVTIAIGNQGNSTLTTTVSGSFNNAITLSATGAPAGTTVSFGPNPIAAPGSGTSTMTIAVGTSTAAGTYTITVTGTGGGVQQTTTVSLTVTNPLVSISVTAPLLSMAQNTTVQFTATGTYADQTTQNITTSVTWNSSNPSIATISNSQGTQGLATSLNTAGTTQITATMGSVTSPPVTLTVTSATLVSIAVTPANPQIVYQTQQAFVATGTYSDSSTQIITGSVTWASSDTTKITITVSGLATGVNTTTSPVTISATQGSVTGSTTATVTAASVVSIAISPNITTLAQSTSRAYTATATLANGSTLNVTNVATWTSSAPAIATVGIHTGLVTAQAVTSSHNPVNIQVTYNGVNQTLTLDVTNATAQTVTVTPVSAMIPVGVQQRLNAVALFTDGTSQDITQNASWSTSPTGIANINAFGIATAVASGTTTVTASFESVSGNAQLTVSTATLSSIAVTPTQALLAPASTISYQAVGHYSDGSTQFISNLVTWSSTNTSVVSITTAGVATGQSAGTANITATFQSVTSNSAGVVVTSFPLTSIAVTPASATVPVDVAQQFTAIGTFANSTTQNLTTNVTWASSQPSVATINSGTTQPGLAIGVAPGQTGITAVFASIVSNQAALTVSSATLVSIALTPSNTTANVGTTVNYVATGKFVDPQNNVTFVNLTAQATWTSSVPSVATINTSNGLASTASPGTTVISASFTQNGVTVTGMTNLTVQ